MLCTLVVFSKGFEWGRALHPYRLQSDLSQRLIGVGWTSAHQDALFYIVANDSATQNGRQMTGTSKRHACLFFPLILESCLQEPTSFWMLHFSRSGALEQHVATESIHGAPDRL